MDLLMLAVTGGTERTRQEFSDLLSKAGFKLGK
jgi:O-methyltransferase